jgi:hypothetical protein
MEKILSQAYLISVISEAEKRGKSADFSGKTIEGFIISDRRIKVPIFFKKTRILGQVYFNNVIFEKEINLEDATINGAFSLSECEVKENFIARRISVCESFNFRGNIFQKNIDLEGGQIRGFLSLNKSKIMGRLNFRKVNVLDLQERIGKIVGNFYFEDASVNEIIIENSIIDGNLSLSGTKILNFLSITNAKIKGELKFSHKDVLKAKIKERKKTEAEIQREY